MKKLFLALATTVALSAAAVSASAATTMDATDVLTFINGYAIQSYTADGCTWVNTEDLNNFGVRLEWDGNARTLSMNFSEKYFSDVKTAWTVGGSGFPVGPVNSANTARNLSAYAALPEFNVPATLMLPITASDIKVYMAGKLVDSYNAATFVGTNSMYVKFADLVNLNDPNFGFTYDWSPSMKQENVTITPYGFVNPATNTGMRALQNANSTDPTFPSTAVGDKFAIPYGDMTQTKAYELLTAYLNTTYNNVNIDPYWYELAKFNSIPGTSFNFQVIVDGTENLGNAFVTIDALGHLSLNDNLPAWVGLIYGK